MAEPVRVYLGNRQAIEVLPDPDDNIVTAIAEGRAPRRLRRPVDTDGPAKRCTELILAPSLPLLEAAHDITHPGQGVWQAHSDADTPAWVASTWPALATLLADHWGCELREVDLNHQPSGGEG